MNKSSVKLAPLVSVVTTFTIGASIVYESALHWRLAQDLMDLVKPIDFISSPMRWMPETLMVITVLAAIGALLNTYVWPQKPRNRTVESWLQRSKLGKVFVAQRRTILLLMPLLLAPLFQPVEWEFGFIGLLYVAWVLLACVAYEKANEPQFLGDFSKSVWIYGPLVALLIGLYAIWEADVIVNKRGVYSVTLQDKRVVGEATLVRNLQDGLLIYDSREESLKYFPWERIHNVTRNVHSEKESILCREFKWFCKKCM